MVEEQDDQLEQEQELVVEYIVVVEQGLIQVVVVHLCNSREHNLHYQEHHRTVQLVMHQDILLHSHNSLDHRFQVHKMV